jgi:hypothetical protein
MSSSRRPRQLALVLAVTSLAAAPATAAAMPAGPDAPSAGGSANAASPAPEPPARVSAPLASDGEDVAVLLATGAFLVVVAGGTAFAHRHAHAFPPA